MAVPKRFRPLVGKPLIMRSLETEKVEDARLLAAQLRADLIVEWSRQAGSIVPTEDDIEDAAVIAGHDLVRSYEDERRRALRGEGVERWRRNVERARINLEAQQHLTATGDPSMVRYFADAMIAELGFDLPPESEGYAKLCEHLNTARLAALDTSYRAAQGQTEAETDSKLVQRVRDREAAKAKPGETIAELFEVYAGELLAAKEKRPAVVDQDRMVIGRFAEFIGAKLAVSAITFDDAKAFVDALEKVPAGYSKRADYRGLTIHEAIEKGQRDGAAPLSVITQQRYISTLSPLFKWLKSEKGGRRVRENHFEGLHKNTRKIRRANTRPPFTAAQITNIVNSPLFTGFLADGKENLAGNVHADDWRKWIPLICLFTGARIGEVAQLRVDDFVRDHGIWCVELRHDEKAGQRTKSDKDRSVALHSTLIKIGVLAFVERQRARAERDGNRQLFPDLRPGPRQQYGDEPSKWWRGYLDKIGVKAADGRDGFGSHSFRHTMADQLRAAGHMDAVFGPLVLGHATNTVTGGYGEGKQGTAQVSQSLIESVRFVPIERGRLVEGGEPVDFSHLINT